MKVILAASFVIAIALNIGLGLMIWHEIKSWRPGPSRAAFEFHGRFHLEAFRQWADQQFEAAKTNPLSSLTIPKEAIKSRLQFSTLSFNAGEGTSDPSMFGILEVGGWGGTVLFVYPTNSTTDHWDEKTFHVTNHIYVRFEY